MTKLPELKSKLMKSPEFEAAYEAAEVTPLLTKQCCDCKEWRAAGDFYRDRSKKDGLERRCKKCSSDRLRAKWQNDPEWREKQKQRTRDYERRPEVLERRRAYEKTAKRTLSARVRHRNRRKDPEVQEQKRKDSRLQTIRYAIAVGVCKRLGIDLTKLAKEQYDAEQRAKQTEQELHQDQRSPAEDLRTAEGRPGNQAGRCRARSAGVVPGT